MPELPEIFNRALHMNKELPGKIISNIEILQHKCLNIPVQDFKTVLTGAVFQKTTYRGKWLVNETNQGCLLINLGMGGEILLVTRQSLPAKYRLIFDFTDESCLVINFWWFGYAYYADPDQLFNLPMLARLGPNAIDINSDDLTRIIGKQRTRLKSFLLDQTNIAGIGNAYIHDILFFARLHPMRQVNTLTPDEVVSLQKAIQDGLQPSIQKGGAFYEVGLHGEKGGFSLEDIVIGYKEGRPCPVCGTEIIKIKTGSTSSFLCPQCQQS
jgi:formamidopyrimidine-DNA glycosylase